jgi:hypothetical protein
MDPNGESDLEISASLQTIKGEVREGIFKADGSVSIGYAETMVRLQVNADKTDGKGMVGTFGKASGLNVTGEAGAGTDALSVSLKGVGDLLTTTAQAGIGIKDGGGGIILEGRAAVASGRVTLEFNVLGWEVEVGVSGYAGSVSGSLVAGYFPNEGFKLKVGGSAGFGADAVLRVKPK